MCLPYLPYLPCLPYVPHLPYVPCVPYLPYESCVPYVPYLPYVLHLPYVPPYQANSIAAGPAKVEAKKAAQAAAEAAARRSRLLRPPLAILFSPADFGWPAQVRLPPDYHLITN